MNKTINVSARKLYEIAFELLKAFGVPEELAKRGANTLNAADVRGVDSHGVARLKFYDRCIEKGEVKVNPNITIIKETPNSVVFDCDYGLGIITADIVMDKAIELAKSNGVGIATGINGHHFGIAGHYALKAAKHDLIGFACSPSLPLVAPTGGKKKMLGNSPHSLAFPAGFETPGIMMDMAATIVAGGKIQMALRKGEKVPLGWILDKDGNDTQEPTDFEDENGVIHGSLVPMAGAKGYCIIVMIELLSAILSGAKTGPNLIGGGAGLGYFMMAINPEIIRPIGELKRDLDDYYHMIKNSERKEGVSEIFLPGEIEHKNTQKRLAEGIDLNEAVANELLTLMKKYNIISATARLSDLFS